MLSPTKAKASFSWEDPFHLDAQLTDDERAVRDAAAAVRLAATPTSGAPTTSHICGVRHQAAEGVGEVLLELMEIS